MKNTSIPAKAIKTALMIICCLVSIISITYTTYIYALTEDDDDAGDTEIIDTEGENSAGGNGSEATCSGKGCDAVHQCGFIVVDTNKYGNISSLNAGYKAANGNSSSYMKKGGDRDISKCNNHGGSAYVYTCKTDSGKVAFGYDESTFSYDVGNSISINGFESANYSDVVAARNQADVGSSVEGQTQYICVEEEEIEEEEDEEVKIKPQAGLCPEVDGKKISRDYGNIAGDSYVINHSADAAGQNKAWTFLIYARPGDSIQFRHRFCAGVNYTRGNNNSSDTDYRGSFPGNIHNPYTVKYGISAEPNINYAFGKPGLPASFYFENRFNKDDPSTYYKIKGGEKFSESEGAPKIDKAYVYDYGFIVYSPSFSANNTYKCSAGVFATNAYVQPAYQIPGFKSGSCESADIVGDTSNVGFRIAQTLGHNEAYGYVQSHSLTPVEVGICEKLGYTCKTDRRYTRNNDTDKHVNKDDPWVNRVKAGPSKSWDQAFEQAGSAPYWGRYWMGCSPVKCCDKYSTGPFGVENEQPSCPSYSRECPYSCNCSHSYSTTEEVPVDYNYDGVYDGTTTQTIWHCTQSSKSYSDPHDWVKKDQFNRPVRFDYQTNGGKTEQQQWHTAEAYIPYNFDTEINYVHITNHSQIVYGGSEVESVFGFSVKPQFNVSVAVKDYATHTPDYSKYVMIDFYLAPGQGRDKIEGDDNYGYPGISGDSSVLCSFFGVQLGSTCKIIKEVDGALNPTGNYDGQSYSYAANGSGPDNPARTVPDVEPGSKYCVAMGVYPSNSHNRDVPNNANNLGIGLQGGNTWNISYASCRTINKKPNFQVWGGGIWTLGQVRGAVSNKAVSAVLGNWSTGTKRSYGSWEEYIIVAGKEVNGIASGAAYGYNPDHKMGLPFGGNTYNIANGDRNPQTVSNNDKNNIGNSKITSVNSNVLARLKARYRDYAAERGEDSYRITTTETGLQQLYKTGNMSISQISGIVNDYASSGIQNTTSHNNDALYKDVTDTDHSTQDNTLVIYVTGTLTIDQNICYSNSSNECNNGEADVLNSYSLTTNAISRLPQIIIFANNISISESVDRVEAWLVMDESGEGGLLHTCAGHSSPDSSQCTKTLVITGPVFAKSISLKRTAGSNPGINESYNCSNSSFPVLCRNLSEDGSIAPGEIFNLRPDAYYWAYNQAQRSTEAVVTYIRELAPRY